MKTCTISGCDKKVMAKGWCSTHYQRWRFHGNPEYNHKLQYEGVCNVEGCQVDKFQRGYCQAHYMRWWRHGDPLKGNATPEHGNPENFCGNYMCQPAARLRRHIIYLDNKVAYLARAKSQLNEKTRQYKKNWKDKNPAKVLVHGRLRKRRQQDATPPWLTEAQWDKMNVFYHEARRRTIETGVEHHVDHIVPLAGKNVRGLHVPWNLRVLTATENMKRNNTSTS